MNILNEFLLGATIKWNSLTLVKSKHIVEDGNEFNISVKTSRWLQWTKKHKQYLDKWICHFLICKRHLLIVSLQGEYIIMMIKIIIMITIAVIIVMLNILHQLILKVLLWSHMKIVYYIVIPITTFIYIYNIRNNFIVTEQLNLSPTKYLIFYWFGLYFWFCFLPLI